MMIPMKESILTGLMALGLSGTQCGCVAGMSGAGKTGLAYDSTSRIYMFHEVDGDKEGKVAESRLDLDPLLNMILEYQAAQSEPLDESDPDPDDSQN